MFFFILLYFHLLWSEKKNAVVSYLLARWHLASKYLNLKSVDTLRLDVCLSRATLL